MSAILHSIITSIENDRIKNIIYIWKLQKNIQKNIDKINESIRIFNFFTPRVSLFVQQMNKIKRPDRWPDTTTDMDTCANDSGDAQVRNAHIGRASTPLRRT